MKTIAVVLLLFATLCLAQTVPPSPKPCLIVKHKGTLGRRLLFTALIGVPIAPGAKFDLVDSVAYPAAKAGYKGSELQAAQAAGVHVIVLETKYSAIDLENARKACSHTD